jgi:hypothetical protein
MSGVPGAITSAERPTCAPALKALGSVPTMEIVFPSILAFAEAPVPDVT